MRICLLLSLLTIVCFPQTARSEDPSLLLWSNGDFMNGELVDATKGQIRWKSPQFVDPFTLQLGDLRSIRFPRSEVDEDLNNAFQAVLKTGDAIYGELISISEKEIVISSGRHGKLPLSREAVHSLRRLENSALIYSGPKNNNEWQVVGPNGDWSIDTDGRLATAQRDSAVYLPVEISEMVSVEFELQWTADPAFAFSLFKPNRNKVDSTALSFLIDTWDDELVLETEEDFEPLVTLKADMKSLNLRLFWNRKAGKLSVYSKDGTELKTMKVPDKKGLEAGVFLRNKGANLAISNIRIGRWNGKQPRPIEAGKSRLHLINGDIVYGTVETYVNDNPNLNLLGSEQKSIEISKIDSLYFANDAEDWIATGDTRIVYFDGSRLQGDLVSVKNDQITLKSRYANNDVTAQLIGMRQIDFSKQSRPMPADLAVIEFDGGKLHGKMIGGRTPETAIGWAPIGSMNNSPILPDGNAKITRPNPTKQESPTDELRDVIYLRNRDIIPCKVLSISDKFVHIQTGYGERNKVLTGMIKAVELAGESDLQMSGFESRQWILNPDNENAIKRTKDAIVFSKSGRIAHASILRGNELKFNAKWTARLPIQLKANLNSGDVNSPNSPSISFQITCTNGQVFVVPTGEVSSTRPISVKNTAASFRFISDGKRMRCYVNKQLACTKTIQRGSDRGNGLLISLNTFRREVNNAGALFTMTDFEIRNASKQRVTRRVSSEKKQTVLTLPRMYRNKPPSHVLVARNGDLLRGRLRQMTDKKLTFTSRMDDLAIPRERVSTVVWLHQEEIDQDEPEAPPEMQADRVRLVFIGGTTISISPTGFSNNSLHGHSSVLGKCVIPIEYLRELHIGSFVKLNESVAYGDWRLKRAPEPKFAGGPTEDGAPREGAASPLVGTIAADFELQTLDGKSFKLSDHKGKVIVLDFWATWCGPCVRAMPEIMKAVESFDDEVILIGVNQQETVGEVQKFLDDREWKLSVAMDREGAVANDYQANAIPQTVIVDQEGNIALVHVGFTPQIGEKLVSMIAELRGENVAN